MTELAERLVRPIVRIPWRVLLILALAAGLLIGAQWLRYEGKALPAVRVLGVDVGGESRADVERDVFAAGRRALAQPIVVHAREGLVTVRPASVLRVDVPRTATAVLEAGRGSVAGEAFFLIDPVSDHRVAPVYRIRERGLAALLARVQRFGRPPHEATVEMAGLEPVVDPSRAGVSVDRSALIAAIERAVEGGRGPVVATFVEAPPRIATAAADRAALEARVAVSAPVRLTHAGTDVGSLSPQRLARLLRFVPAGHRFRTTFDAARLARAVRPLVQQWRHRARNARFAVHGETVSVAPSKPGRDVDPGGLREALTAAALGPGVRSAAVPLADVPADLTTEEANALGIRRKLVSFTTEMGASSSNRIHNVHLMADYIDGTTLKPGQTFSYNDVVGPRTPERGFLEGQMIVGTLVLPSIGGGVCQTATTLFNDAFELGLPILERHNHSLYISHYPLGRDATVSWGGPDFVFRNDLKHGLLIKSSYTDSTLTFTFYGTPEHRRVTSTTGEKTNWKSPTMSYAIDPNAPPGSVKVVGGTNASGFQVTVKREVRDARGKLLHKASFLSTYVPQGPTTVYGPGRTPPGPYIVLPKT